MDRAQDRYRALVAELLAERGNAHGSKKEVAAILGVTPEHLSRVVAGSRRVGWPAMRAAADALDFDFDYFIDEPRGKTPPSFLDYRRTLDAAWKRPRTEPSHETLQVLRRTIARFRKTGTPREAHMLLRDAEKWLAVEAERAAALHDRVRGARETALGDAAAGAAAREILLPLEDYFRQLARDLAADNS